MTRKDQRAQQDKRDIGRAELKVALAWGLTRDASVETLRYRAAAERVSLHAAALAVLSVELTDPDDLHEQSSSEQWPERRHLHALTPLAADDAATTTSSADLTKRRGRHRRR